MNEACLNLYEPITTKKVMILGKRHTCVYEEKNEGISDKHKTSL